MDISNQNHLTLHKNPNAMKHDRHTNSSTLVKRYKNLSDITTITTNLC